MRRGADIFFPPENGSFHGQSDAEVQLNTVSFQVAAAAAFAPKARLFVMTGAPPPQFFEAPIFFGTAS